MTKMQVYVHDEADSRNFLHCYHRLTWAEKESGEWAENLILA